MRIGYCQFSVSARSGWGLLMLLACTAPASHRGAAPSWPLGASEPSIVYLQSIAGPADIGAKPAALSRLANWITGANQNGANLVKPFGLTVDEAGDLLVTDTGAASVAWLQRERRRWVHWEQVGKTRFACPVAAAKHRDTFFVADSGLGKVIAFDEKGKLRFEITKDLERPSGLAVLGDQLFIADSQQHHILICNTRTGSLISRFGQRGSGPAEFNFPTHIAAAPGGKILVTDSLNYRVEVFDQTGRFERIIGSAGDGPGNFSRPKGVASDNVGHAYVVDAVFDNVQIFDEQGRLLLNWGETGSEPGQFWLPNAIAITRKNEIYVADSYNGRIQVFQYTGKP